MKPRHKKQTVQQPENEETNIVEIKRLDAIESVNSLRDLCQHPFRFSLGFRLKRIWNQIVNIHDEFQKQRFALIKEYGKFNDVTRQWEYEEGKEDACQAELNKLLEENVSIICKPFKASEFGNYETSVETLVRLDWLIQE